ncbi:universal stress protein [Halogeometricum sp. S1BR25-6]|uniref:Universal stress protein n=1 Tax=Halogeometricum salsisoli TaxID=2950536 RepID=A0ABU2GJN6_9EURY|nr:universal stress protein [Halogeometricum sp. S1BR25-6]MDS0301021.1 universal stress protein [Halogeometricum sp. S1BR25-6]
MEHSPPDEHDCVAVATDGDGIGRPGVLCLLSRDKLSQQMELRIAAGIADGGALVVSGVDSEEIVRWAHSESLLANVEVDSVERPESLTEGWLTSVVDERDLSTIVDARRNRSRFSESGSIEVEADCTVVTVEIVERINSVSSLLVPVTAGPHVDAVLDVSRALAEATDSWLDLFTAVEDDENLPSEVETLLSHCRERLGTFEDYDEWVYEAPDPAEAIIEQSQYYDVTVLGATQKGKIRKYISGSTAGVVRNSAQNVVLTVKASDVTESRLEQWFGEGT